MPDDNESCGCPPKLALSEEEERLLRRMRELRETYRALQAEPNADVERLETVRTQFRACRKELEQANRAKWIRLGYEP